MKKSFAMHDDYRNEEQTEAVLPAEKGTDSLPYDEIPDYSGPSDLSSQMDQVVRGLSGVQVGGQVYLVDVRQLEPFPEQPFHPYPLQLLQELADDIAHVGILSPILTRRYKSKLQILAGHNRWSAAKLAGLDQVPVMILEADDDQAVLILTSTNLRQREKLLPSERAFAYKMQMDALKRQGQRAEGGYNAASFITRQTGDSRMQIHRFVRLTELDPGLMELLDKGKISLTPAVSVSYLSPEDQREVSRCVKELGAKLTIEKSAKLKEMAAISEGGSLGVLKIGETLLQTSCKERMPEVFSIRYAKIQEFLPKELASDEVERWIINALQAMKP